MFFAHFQLITCQGKRMSFWGLKILNLRWKMGLERMWAAFFAQQVAMRERAFQSQICACDARCSIRTLRGWTYCKNQLHFQYLFDETFLQWCLALPTAKFHFFELPCLYSNPVEATKLARNRDERKKLRTSFLDPFFDVDSEFSILRSSFLCPDKLWAENEPKTRFL